MLRSQGVMTYVIIRPVMTVIGIVCTLTNVYGDGEWRFNRFYPYSALFNGIAQFWALYCLVLMYQVRMKVTLCQDVKHLLA